MRKGLDALYLGAGALAALCLIAILAIIVAQMICRWIGVSFPGSTAYAGYFMASASFLAFPYALNANSHIRVNLFLTALGEHRYWAELWCYAVGSAATVWMAYYACNLVWWSWKLNDISQERDALPLWIPQLPVAIRCRTSRHLFRGQPRVADGGSQGQRRFFNRLEQGDLTDDGILRGRYFSVHPIPAPRHWCVGGVGLVGRRLCRYGALHESPGRRHDDDYDLGNVVVLDAYRIAVVHLDGGDPLSHPPVRRHVPRTFTLDGAPAGRSHTYQYRRLHGLCRRVRIIGRDTDHGRQDVDPGIAPARLSRAPWSSGRWPAPPRSD